MLKKFEALGRLIETQIEIYIMVNDNVQKNEIRKIKQNNKTNYQYISINFLTQLNYGCLDRSGRIVVTDTKSVLMHPNGSGDIWANFSGKTFQESGLDKFKYASIIGVSNFLEHCFDCFMIGKLISEQIPWITMSTK